ncbi:30S ribosomal protein S1 [Calycomorphotria hydatis]|uniref:30S ribosomal protein S1 n=2 Tax=Calycomorphotria hydatis TaxID=2528027 RepID=A0A517T7X8_9PLAN|nr:30S ribosomal protein S1 [Calycomorphotria hydatis]
MISDETRPEDEQTTPSAQESHTALQTEQAPAEQEQASDTSEETTSSEEQSPSAEQTQAPPEVEEASATQEEPAVEAASPSEETAPAEAEAATPQPQLEEPTAAPVEEASTEPQPTAEVTETTEPSAPAATEETPAPTAEVPTTEPPATAAVEEKAEEAKPEEASRPRVKLNPTMPADTAKAVPSLGDAAGESGPQGPVEVALPDSEQLDQAMEAELEAAMSGAAKPEQPAAPAAESEESKEAAEPEGLTPGKKVTAVVQSVGEENVFFEIKDERSTGIAQLRQFPKEKPPEAGQSLTMFVDAINEEEGTINLSPPRAKRKPSGNWDAVAEGQIVDCMVTKSNKGGLEVSISNLRGFLPASQVEMGFVENLDSYVGQKLTVQIIEVKPQKRNLVVSRRAYLRAEQDEQAGKVWEELSVNQTVTGTVKTLKDYGAFIDLGGVDGFLHVGEISWNRIGKPADMLQVGQQIEVKILKLDKEAKKIGLGMKQLIQNPWAHAEEKYPVESTVSGKVTRTTEFGAFVELEQGVEGLIHISELDYRRVATVNEVLNVGDTVDAQVLSVEKNRKRIALSVKALKPKPEAPAQEAAAEQQREPYKRKRKGPLRGGTGSSEGGGLFGNPNDFS